jgi:hypothetical protein
LFQSIGITTNQISIFCEVYSAPDVSFEPLLVTALLLCKISESNIKRAVFTKALMAPKPMGCVPNHPGS